MMLMSGCGDTSGGQSARSSDFLASSLGQQPRRRVGAEHSTVDATQPEEALMAWFKRLRRRLKNYASDGDYAGSHGGGGGAPSESTQSTAFREAAITEVRTRGSVGPGG